MKKAIIIANGNFLVKEILLEASKDRQMIALDGAVNKLARLNMKPHVILGDFDSISKNNQKRWGIQKTFDHMEIEDTPYLGHHDTHIVPAKNQALTDLTKAIHYCDAQGITEITIVCATGGRLDHHEGVIRSLRVEYQKERPIILHTEQQSLRYAKDETIIFYGEIGDKCGILAFPHAIISTQGLQYDADQLELNFAYSENTCNAMQAKEATVTVQGEALLVMPPHLKAQRDFMKLSEEARLEKLLRDLKA